MKRLIVFACLIASPAFGQQQQPDPAKLAPLLRQQRDIANDSIAVCSATVIDLQARVAELEKRLPEAQAK
jgi:hypothetical protein